MMKENILKLIPMIENLGGNLDEVIKAMSQEIDQEAVVLASKIFKGIAMLGGIKETDKDEIMREAQHLVTDISLVLQKEMGSDGKKLSLVLGAMVSLLNGDIQGVNELASQIGNFDQEKMDKLIKTVSKFSSQLNQPSANKNESIENNKSQNSVDEEKVFDMFDKDKSNNIDYYEFKEVCKYMNLILPEEEYRRVFLEVDVSGEGTLDRVEFSKCLKIIKRRSGDNTLANMGLSTGKIVAFVAMMTIQLVLIFFFIFMGIQSFSTPGGFEAVINAIMPMAGGGGAGSSGPSLDNLQTECDKFITKFFNEMKKRLNSPI